MVFRDPCRAWDKATCSLSTTAQEFGYLVVVRSLFHCRGQSQAKGLPNIYENPEVWKAGRTQGDSLDIEFMMCQTSLLVLEIRLEATPRVLSNSTCGQ